MLPIVLLASLVASATASSNYTLPEGFDLNLVKESTRSSWCLAERNSCPKICGGVAETNLCDPLTLDFTCKCANGSDANVALYASTIPFFVCEENFGQCISRSTTLDGNEKCEDAKKQCGSLNASEASSASSTTSSATSLPTETESSSSDDSSSPSATTSGSGAAATTSSAAIRMVQEHATGLLATVLFVGMRLVL